MSGYLGKRIMDIFVSAILLVILSPLLAAIALLVRLYLGSPVFFTQLRPGLHGTPFLLFKFRTMTEKRDAAGNLLADSERLTAFGKFLRSTSIDEFPELINVLKGEMSLVGPRPLLMRYYPYFTDEERVRFLVRPGITGLAQISGRNDLPWDQRLATDVAYVQSMSLWLDLKILWATFGKVLTRHGLQVDPGSVLLNLDEERRERFQASSSSPEATHSNT